MTFKNNKTKIVPLIGLSTVILFWLVDAVLDIYIFKENDSFVVSLFYPAPMELWMRLVASALIIFISLYAARLINQQHIAGTHLIAQRKKLQILADALEKEMQERRKVEQRLKKKIAHDELTSLLNRGKFDEILEDKITSERRQQAGLTLLFCDIDSFKMINDTHGHDIGDRILQLFAQRLRTIIRDTDVVARWGGEEFIILLFDTHADVAEEMANKIRSEIEQYAFPPVGKVTVSIGVAHYQDKDDRHSILKRADKALYSAKEKGRNRMEVADR